MSYVQLAGMGHVMSLPIYILSLNVCNYSWVVAAWASSQFLFIILCFCFHILHVHSISYSSAPSLNSCFSAMHTHSHHPNFVWPVRATLSQNRRRNLTFVSCRWRPRSDDFFCVLFWFSRADRRKWPLLLREFFFLSFDRLCQFLIPPRARSVSRVRREIKFFFFLLFLKIVRREISLWAKVRYLRRVSTLKVWRDADDDDDLLILILRRLAT